MNNIPSGMLIHEIFYPVIVLGPGKRVGIWVQGCSIHCNGCMSSDTWDFDDRFFLSFPTIIEKLKKYRDIGVNKLTISGGEPFDQSNELLFLLKNSRLLGFSDILVYSGYNFPFLLTKFQDHLDYIDVLISEPFQIESSNTKKWCGSDNQKIHLFSDNYEFDEFYLNNKNCYRANREIQIELIESKIFLIGIPHRDDIERIKLLIRKQIE